MDWPVRRLNSTSLRSGGLAAALLAVTACEGAFTSRVDVAATADGAELPVGVLAEVIAQNPQLPLRRDVAEGIALLWVDFTLFANELVAGDSLLDSATVLAATWPDVQQTIASTYHARLFGDSMVLDSAQVDSIYAAGDYRLIKHVLFHLTDTTSANIGRMKRAQAEYVLGQLRRGEITWAEATTVTDEPEGEEREGSLGVVARGELVGPFEAAAFGLTPGEVSDVVHTTFGYHIIHRPELAEVREAFWNGVEERLRQDSDSLYLEQLEDRWDIRVRSGAVPAVREMAVDPLRSKASDKVIGSYRGGTFRVRDLARWVQGMDPRIRQGLATGSDPQIERMVRTLIRNEVLIREAMDANIGLSPDDFTNLQDLLRRRIALVRGHLALVDDTITAFQQLPAPAQQERVQLRITSHLQDLARDERPVRMVPPFLADHLRERARWKIMPAGIERALARARDRRTQLDSARSTQPPRRGPIESPSSPPPADGVEGA